MVKEYKCRFCKEIIPEGVSGSFNTRSFCSYECSGKMWNRAIGDPDNYVVMCSMHDPGDHYHYEVVLWGTKENCNW